MEDILRDHWNWTIDNNYITSDCNAILDSKCISALVYFSPTPHLLASIYTPGVL